MRKMFTISNNLCDRRKPIIIWILILVGVFGWHDALNSRPGSRPSLVADYFLQAGLQIPGVHRFAPDFSTVSLDGEPIKLSYFRGTVVILHFWATFCAPCRGEMLELNELQNEFRSSGLLVLTISIDTLDSSVQSFLRKEGIDSLLTARERSLNLRNSYQVQGIPMTYIIDQKGRIIARKKGRAKWRSDEMMAGLRSLLEQ